MERGTTKLDIEPYSNIYDCHTDGIWKLEIPVNEYHIFVKNIGMTYECRCYTLFSMTTKNDYSVSCT